MNRISQPNWVKLCVDPNGRIKLRAKQKYEILSATEDMVFLAKFKFHMREFFCFFKPEDVENFPKYIFKPRRLFLFFNRTRGFTFNI